MTNIFSSIHGWSCTDGWPDDPAERASVRAEHIAGALILAEKEARAWGRSIKCRDWPGRPEHRPQHRDHPDGCINDGRTCLCDCHDGQRAITTVKGTAP